MLTVPQAAKLSGRNPETIRRWIREGKLPASKVGTQHVIDEGDFEAVLHGPSGFRRPEDQGAGRAPYAAAGARPGRQISETMAPYGTGAVTRSPQAVGDPWLPAIVGRIVRLVDPVRIILFGSRARGDARPDSDYDILVVLDEIDERRAMRLRIRAAIDDLPISKDIIVATTQEEGWAPRLLGDVLQSAVAEGRVVYERT